MLIHFITSSKSKVKPEAFEDATSTVIPAALSAVSNAVATSPAVAELDSAAVVLIVPSIVTGMFHQ